MMLDADDLSDEELLAYVTLLGGTVRDRSEYYWVEGDCVMYRYHSTWRATALDYLAYKGVLNGPTNGRFDVLKSGSQF